MEFSYYKRDWPEWEDYYNKPVGREPVFHVNVDNEIYIVQNDGYDTYRYKAISDVDTLAKIINRCKKKYTGFAGGSFCINEYGQVIVPLTPQKDIRGRVLEWRSPRYVGEICGDITFYDAASAEEFSLDTALRCGERWPFPYLGMKYNLSYRQQIYMKIVEGGDVHRDYLQHQNPELIRLLRKIHPREACSFLVNPWGHVLTKQQIGEDWIPVYVGKLNYDNWFDKPDYGF